LKVTTRTEYGLLALIHLSRATGDEYVTSVAIAEAQGLPLKFLEQILSALKGGRLVTSQRGQRGGYKLARQPERIFIADVIRLLESAALMDDPHRIGDPPAAVEREKRLSQVFADIRKLVASRLERTSLADVR
jgi:Rrf2 family transcriptional regulator, cysteine metabolism repressor